LFCDNIAHDNASQSFINEISFERPVKIQQIRIIKGGSLITPRFRSGFNTSLTQTETIKNFEIYAKDILNPSAKYATLIAANNLKELVSTDAIFTIPRDVLFFSKKSHIKGSHEPYRYPWGVQNDHLDDIWRSQRGTCCYEV
jgi:hypothetical protein